jgi:type I restriction enzyme S subunit
MKDGRLVIEACKPVSKETYIDWSRRMVPVEGDLVLAREAPVGQVIRVPQRPRICLGQRTVLIRSDVTRVHPRFLHYWLLGPDAQQQMTAQAAGATVPHLNVEDIRRLDVSKLPQNREHQHAAAETLGAIDDLIENNRLRVQVLEEMARAIYCEWFVHFRYPGHESVALVDSPRGALPEGWGWGQVDTHFLLQRGFDLPASEREPGPVPIIGASGVQGFHSTAKAQGPGLTTGRSGTVGVVTYVPDDFWPLNTSLWVKEFRLSTPRYAYFLLSSINLMQSASGAAVPTLNRNVVHALPAICPPRSLIELWDAAAAPMFDSMDVLRRQNRRLEGLRDLLLPRLVIGQIDVSSLDLDALVEDSVA